MNKTHHLLQMLEQPHAYTEAQWLEVLSDMECAQNYTMMSLSKGLYCAQKEISGEDVESEWQRLVSAQTKTSFLTRRLLRVAVVFIAVLFLSGIAFAAVCLVRHNRKKTEIVELQESPKSTNLEIKNTFSTQQPVVFDNVSLSCIVQDIATYHNIQAEVTNHESAKLRFYFVWKRQDGLQKVVDQLNQFKQVHIVVENNMLIVK